MALLLVSAGALAAGPVGPVGPVGPIGPPGAESSDVPRPARPSAVPRPALPTHPASSAAPSGNRIEVSGNTASGTRCAGEGTASVNSVDVSGARLDGRTVIVQGRNADNVRTTDCPERTQPPAQGRGGAGTAPAQQPSQTNSIRIR